MTEEHATHDKKGEAIRAHHAAFEATYEANKAAREADPEHGRGRTCLTTWFPRLLEAGLPVPRTEIIDAGPKWRCMLDAFEDSPRHAEACRLGCEIMGKVTTGIIAAVQKLGGYPVFLRTGQGSGKHNWKNCCDLRSDQDVIERVKNLIEWSEMVDFHGLSTRFWCVRERLPVAPVATLPNYGDMPLVMEVRCFIQDGAVKCAHPYWPEAAIRAGLADRDENTARLLFIDTHPGLYRDQWMPLAEAAAQVFANDGAWSLDLLQTERGWSIIDMADAARSYHYPGCPISFTGGAT